LPDIVELTLDDDAVTVRETAAVCGLLVIPVVVDDTMMVSVWVPAG
jgi:hypothetical protein